MKTSAPIQRKRAMAPAVSTLGQSRGFIDGVGVAPEPAPAGHDFSRVSVDVEGGEARELARAGTTAPAGPVPFRGRLERAFGTDLGWVKAHRGPAARDAAEALGTGAYAHEGAMVLGAKSDLATVAEETAHLLQQSRGGGSGAALEPRHSPAEVEAVAAARAVTAGQTVEQPTASLSPGTVALNGEHKKNQRPSNRAKHQKGQRAKVVNAKARAQRAEKEKGKRVAKPSGGRFGGKKGNSGMGNRKKRGGGGGGRRGGGGHGVPV